MTSNDVPPYYEEKRKRLATPILKLTLTTLVSRLVWWRCVASKKCMLCAGSVVRVERVIVRAERDIEIKFGNWIFLKNTGKSVRCQSVIMKNQDGKSAFDNILWFMELDTNAFYQQFTQASIWWL